MSKGLSTLQRNSRSYWSTSLQWPPIQEQEKLVCGISCGYQQGKAEVDGSSLDTGIIYGDLEGAFKEWECSFFLTPMLLMGSFIGYFPEEVNLLPHSSPFTKEKARIWLSLGQESSVCDTWLRKLCLWQNYTQYRVVREFLSLVQKKRFAETLQRKEKDSGKSISLIPHLRTKQ